MSKASGYVDQEVVRPFPISRSLLTEAASDERGDCTKRSEPALLGAGELEATEEAALGGQQHSSFPRVHLRHIGLASSHFTFLRLHDRHPVLVLRHLPSPFSSPSLASLLCCTLGASTEPGEATRFPCWVCASRAEYVGKSSRRAAKPFMQRQRASYEIARQQASRMGCMKVYLDDYT